MTKIKLTRKEKECVREWLKDKNRCVCPFFILVREIHVGCYSDKKCRVCYSYFSKVRPKVNSYHRCPCHLYQISTVIKRAKEMLK
jgi:hypothetical protein